MCVVRWAQRDGVVLGGMMSSTSALSFNRFWVQPPDSVRMLSILTSSDKALGDVRRGSAVSGVVGDLARSSEVLNHDRKEGGGRKRLMDRGPSLFHRLMNTEARSDKLKRSNSR